MLILLSKQLPTPLIKLKLKKKKALDDKVLADKLAAKHVAAMEADKLSAKIAVDKSVLAQADADKALQDADTAVKAATDA